MCTKCLGLPNSEEQSGCAIQDSLILQCTHFTLSVYQVTLFPWQAGLLSQVEFLSQEYAPEGRELYSRWEVFKWADEQRLYHLSSGWSKFGTSRAMWFE